MNDINKCLKNIKQFHLENLKTVLVAMKKNCLVKQNFDNFPSENLESEIIQNYLNIFKSKSRFREACYLNWLYNLHKIIKSYDEAVKGTEKEIGKIESIIYTKFKDSINDLFTGEDGNSKELIELVKVDNYIKQINKM